MTPEQQAAVDACLAKLCECVDSDDTEEAHGEADKALCKLLLAFGCHEVVDTFNSIPKWYA